MLDACRLATATMAMGFSFVLLALVRVVLLLIDNSFLPASTDHLPPCSTAAAAPTIVVSWWLLRYLHHKPLDVVSFKCRWQLGMSLFYKTVDYGAFFRCFGWLWLPHELLDAVVSAGLHISGQSSSCLSRPPLATGLPYCGSGLRTILQFQ
jgi:hypothetical protein